jgi:hypothetical protein
MINMKLTKEQLTDLLNLIRKYISDAEFNDTEETDWFYKLDSGCECFSEWTQRPANFSVIIRTRKDRIATWLLFEIEEALNLWAINTLKWANDRNCEMGCKNELSVDLRVFIIKD